MANLQFLTGGDVAPIRKTPSGMFGAVAQPFRTADISFFNLELALSQRGELHRGKATYHRSTPENVDGLAEIGVSCVNLANNHSADYGDAALFETLQVLDQKGIGRFGAGRNLAEARKAHIIEKNGLKVGFLGCTPNLPTGAAATPTSAGVNPMQVYTAYQPKRNLFESPGFAPNIITWTDPQHLQRLREDIAAVAKEVDVLIVYVHWGTSMTPHVHDFQREIGRAAIDAGAHGVFGGHQHVLAAIEFYKGRPIVHCSGNLLFDTWASFFTAETLKTFLFGATIGPEGLTNCYLLPVRNGVDVPPTLLARQDPLWGEILADLQSQSRELGTEFIAREDAVEVRPT